MIAVGSASDVNAQRALDVQYDDGRASEELTAWRLPGDGDVWFVRANDVARLFKANQFWNASSRKVVLGVGRTRFTLTVDTRVVVIDGEPILMRTPVRYDGGFVMVPLEFVLEIASHYTPRTFEWEERFMTLRVRGLGYNVEKVEVTSTASRTTATIDLTEPLLYHMDTETSGLVRLKLYGGRIDAGLFSLREKRGLVEGVRAEQSERDAFVYFEVTTDTRRIRIDRNEEPHQLVLVLEKGELPEIPAPNYSGREVVEIVDSARKERRSFEIKSIVLDPGHGGRDEGKAGVNGLLEKDVNLAIAKEVKNRLEDELDMEVILTRSDDQLLSLTERTEIANTAGGDLFISIHCNAWFSETHGRFRGVLSVAGKERVGSRAGTLRERGRQRRIGRTEWRC